MKRFLPLLMLGLVACSGVEEPERANAWPLADAQSLKLVNVVASPATFVDRPALRVEISPDLQARILDGSATERTSLALVPGRFHEGTIEVEVAAEPNGRGGPDARGFAGIAFRVSDDAKSYEAIYLRMTNGRLAQPPPPPPRDARAIQYVSHPEWTFEQFRQEAPGAYESGADVAPRKWVNLRIEISGATARAFVDGQAAPSLSVADLRRGSDAEGAVGLFLDSGTTAYFRNLRIVPKRAP